jgi:hypothetical protein
MNKEGIYVNKVVLYNFQIEDNNEESWLETGQRSSNNISSITKLEKW